MEDPKNINDVELNKLKKKYMDVKIPKELNKMVQSIIEEQKVVEKNNHSWVKWTTGVAAASIATFIISVNTLPAFAEMVSKIPVIGTMANIVALEGVYINDTKHSVGVDIKTPSIQGLGNQELEQSINKAYMDKTKAAYATFTKEIGDIAAGQLVNRSMNAGYEVIVNNGKLLVLKNYTTKTSASATETVQYTTLDVKKEQLISLPSLFIDDSYINVISQNILEQMKKNPDKYSTVYHPESDPSSKEYDPKFKKEIEFEFTKINAEQKFYINKNGKLVISFDEYEIAPGSSGVVEFEIPTEAIRNILVSNVYVN